MEAQERELVFDIDLTDYDNVRVCCQGGNMCGRCWKFVQAAVAVLDRILEGVLHIRFLLSSNVNRCPQRTSVSNIACGSSRADEVFTAG